MEQNQYNPQPYASVAVKKSNNCATISLVLSLVALIVNPLYGLSIAAIILGIVGLSNTGKCGGCGKGPAIFGMLFGMFSIAVGVIIDIILIPFTFGLSFLF